GVHPTACITWFQAAQACALSGKRLLTNEEWQRAASGTPDPGTDNGTTDCAVSSPDVVNTGSRGNCVSNWGALDMVGSVDEWVADWADRNPGTSGSCADWTIQTAGLIPGFDFSCFGGPGTTGQPGETSANLGVPGAVYRGGSYFEGRDAGVFAISAVL